MKTMIKPSSWQKMLIENNMDLSTPHPNKYYEITDERNGLFLLQFPLWYWKECDLIFWVDNNGSN
jgi:hypothetical protein